MNLKYIDNHAHLNFKVFEDDLEEVVLRMKDRGVGAILVGTNQATSQRAIELANKYDNLWAIVGLHPIHTDASFHDSDEIGLKQSVNTDCSPEHQLKTDVLGDETKPFESKGEIFDKDFYRSLAKHPKCLGIGECGFDFFRVSPETYAIQEKAFRGQVELALELDLPLMLHMRSGNSMNAYQESLKILRAYGATKGEAHFFAGSLDDLKDFIELGFHISFTGVVTFAKQYEELVQATPVDRLLSETDSPYVAPVPHRGKRCEPTYVIEVVKKMAEMKDLEEEGLASKILQNSKNLWKWS